MGNIQRWLSAVATFLLVFTITQPASADAWFTSEAGSPDGSMVVAINEVDEYGGLSARYMVNRSEHREYATCPDGVQPTGLCSGVGPNIEFISAGIMPPCTTDSQENCIESVRYSAGNGEFQNAKYVRSTAGPKYTTVDEANGLYGGSTVSV